MDAAHRNQTIVRLCLENHTGREIAQRVGICPERVRQVLKVAGLKTRVVSVKTLHRPAHRTAYERFLDRVNRTDSVEDCWNWKYEHKEPAARYGRMRAFGSVWYSHHLAWYFSRRQLPRLWVLHRCGHYLCCNPFHLYEGTPMDNAQDRIRHGNSQRGELSPHASVTNTTARELKRRLERAGSREMARIGREFEVPYNLVYRIKHGISWGWLESN